MASFTGVALKYVPIPRREHHKSGFGVALIVELDFVEICCRSCILPTVKQGLRGGGMARQKFPKLRLEGKIPCSLQGCLLINLHSISAIAGMKFAILAVQQTEFSCNGVL